MILRRGQMKYPVTNTAISMNQLELQDICDAAAQKPNLQTMKKGRKFVFKRLRRLRLCASWHNVWKDGQSSRRRRVELSRIR